MALKDERGHAGEALAAAYLALVGFRVVERNLRIAGVHLLQPKEDDDDDDD